MFQTCDRLDDLVDAVGAVYAVLVYRDICHEHSHPEGGVALIEGLAVVIVADETDALFSRGKHIIDKAGDLGRIVHKKMVGGKVRAVSLDGTVHKKDRDVQLADHLAVFIIEHFNADDSLHQILAERVRKCHRTQVLLRNTVGVHCKARLGDLTLEFVQHSGGKVRLCQKSGGQQRDLTLILL